MFTRKNKIITGQKEEVQCAVRHSEELERRMKASVYPFNASAWISPYHKGILPRNDIQTPTPSLPIGEGEFNYASLAKGGGPLAVVGFKRWNSSHVKNLLTYLPTYLFTPIKNLVPYSKTPTPNLPSRKTILNCFARQSPQERGKAAFTLAEVLITLGIIGVVAAMTLPALISNYRKNLVESELKKTYSLLNQLMVRSEADNGSALNWEWQYLETPDRNVQEQFLQKYFVPYLKVVRRKSANNGNYDKVYRAYDASGVDEGWWYNNGTLTDWIELADGTALMFGITNDDRGGRLGYWKVILPHTAKNNYVLMGRDAFNFQINMTSNKTAVSVFPNAYTNWNCELVENNRTSFNEKCRGLASNTTGNSPDQYCTMLLYCNNWKVPDDYPIKF